MTAVIRCNRPAVRPVAGLTAMVAVLAAASAAQAAPAEDAAAAPIPATTAEQARTTAYQADYFAQFAPANALDIVRRVPGFVLEESNGDVRGFSGAAGNVVLNGARPSSKSEPLQALLARIPAGRVLRVEVGPGDLFGSDYAGKAQVANVVLSRAGGIGGNAKVSVVRIHDGRVWGNVEASALIKTGTSSFSLSAGTSRFLNTERGFDDVRRFSDNARLELREKTNIVDTKDPFVSLGWSSEDGANRTAHINLRYAPNRFSLQQRNHVIPTGDVPRDDRLGQDYSNTAYEIGGDITRPLGGGAIKLVALANRRDRDNFDDYNNRLAGSSAVIGGFEQFQNARYDEVLGRLSWTHPNIAGFATELGSEVAYNKLTNATELFLLGPGGARTPIDLPIGRATVDEVRSESYLNLGRPLTSALRIDTTLAFETSRLTVSGDTTARRSLRFFKPGVTLDWKDKSGWHVQASLRREVAQLDFYEFISLAELANDRVNGGNADLKPQREWDARLTIQRPVLGKGLVKLELGYDRVGLLQDRILTADGFDAPGNIGTGTRKFAALTFDAPLDALGLAATRIKFEGQVQDTSVRDPLTGQQRPWSGGWQKWNWQVDLRRDLSRWSYGFTLFDRSPFAFYRTDEIDSIFNSRIFATAFAEYRPDKRTTVRLDVDNAIDTAGQRLRTFYDPNRTAAVPVATEFRHRNTHVIFSLSVNRTFGS